MSVFLLVWYASKDCNAFAVQPQYYQGTTAVS